MWKKVCITNTNLDIVYTEAYIKFDEILSMCSVLKILSGNEIMKEILTSVKGHNSIKNAQKIINTFHT